MQTIKFILPQKFSVDGHSPSGPADAGLNPKSSESSSIFRLSGTEADRRVARDLKRSTLRLILPTNPVIVEVQAM